MGEVEAAEAAAEEAAGPRTQARVRRLVLRLLPLEAEAEEGEVEEEARLLLV